MTHSSKHYSVVVHLVSVQNFNTYSEIQICTNLFFRNDDQEEESQKVQISSVAPVSFETRPHILGSDVVLPESSVEEPQGKDSNGDSVLALHMSEVKEHEI